MMIKSTMQKECATTVTTNTDEPRNPGIALMTNYTQQGCAKTAISTIITEKEDRISRLETKKIMN